MKSCEDGDDALSHISNTGIGFDLGVKTHVLREKDHGQWYPVRECLTRIKHRRKTW